MWLFTVALQRAAEKCQWQSQIQCKASLPEKFIYGYFLFYSRVTKRTSTDEENEIRRRISTLYFVSFRQFLSRRTKGKTRQTNKIKRKNKGINECTNRCKAVNMKRVVITKYKFFCVKNLIKMISRKLKRKKQIFYLSPLKSLFTQGHELRVPGQVIA